VTRKSSPLSQRTRTPKGLELFTDREEQRQFVTELFTSLIKGSLKQFKPVLNFYGIGGIGKTTLLKKIKEELSFNSKDICFVHLDVDDQKWSIATSDVASFFWLMRQELHSCNIQTPLFDCLYAIYYSKQHPTTASQLKNNPLIDFLENASKLGEFSGDVNANLSYLGEVFDAIKAASIQLGHEFKISSFVGKLWENVRDRYREKQLLQLNIDPRNLSAKELELAITDVLHQDIVHYMLLNPAAVITIAVDGFERIQSQAAKEDIQFTLQKLFGYFLTCSISNVKSRCVFLIFGREKLRWEEIYETEWNQDIESYHIGGFEKTDAENFLRRASEFYDREGDVETGENIRKYTSHILTSSRDHERGHHPHFLDLAIEIIRERRECFRPEELGSTPAEMQMRFFRYLSVPERSKEFNSLKVLALSLKFDERLFTKMVELGYITFSKHEFEFLIRNRSYIVADTSNLNRWRFQHFMGEAIIDFILKDSLEVKLARKTIKDIVSFYLSTASRETSTFPESMVSDDYCLGMEIAFYHYDKKLFDFDSFAHFFAEYNKTLDWQIEPHHRVPFYQRFVELYEKQCEKDDVTLPILLSNMGLLFRMKGDYALAETYYSRAMEKFALFYGPEEYESILASYKYHSLLRVMGKESAEPALKALAELSSRIIGKDHLVTFNILNDYGLCLLQRNATSEAEKLFRDISLTAKRLFGEEAQSTLTVIHNLAIVLNHQDKIKEAEILHRQVLEVRERTLGRDHPDTLLSLYNLALVLRLRNSVEAESLVKRCLEVQSNVLGKHHPDTLTTAGLYAFYRGRVNINLAKQLMLDVFYAQNRVLGINHPETADSLQVFVALLKESSEGLPTAAELLRSALQSREVVLGKQHLTTLKNVDQLVALLMHMGLYKECEALCQEWLPIADKVFGSDGEFCRNLNIISGAIRDLKYHLPSQTKFRDMPYLFESKPFKISRNEKCPCGSGKKYKHCCITK
jgi:tetratricopeptide (TPR) repeat protein